MRPWRAGESSEFQRFGALRSSGERGPFADLLRTGHPRCHRARLPGRTEWDRFTEEHYQAIIATREPP
jgi:hypothetical protein